MRKNPRPKIQGYIRLGRHYVSLTFLTVVYTTVFAVGVFYALALHPTVMDFWYTRQSLPEFSIDSPYLASFAGRVRLLQTDGVILYEGDIDHAVITGKGQLYENGVLLYEGGFLENQYHGTGILYAPDGSVSFQGEFLSGVPVVTPEPTPEPAPEPSIEITPTMRLNPLSLFGQTYLEILTALINDRTAYQEQPLDTGHLVIDNASGVIYSFLVDESGKPGVLYEVFLCGLAAAGDNVVGMEADALPWDSVPTVVGTAERFALGLSNMYWSRDIPSESLKCVYDTSGSRLIAAYGYPTSMGERGAQTQPPDETPMPVQDALEDMPYNKYGPEYPQEEPIPTPHRYKIAFLRVSED